MESRDEDGREKRTDVGTPDLCVRSLFVSLQYYTAGLAFYSIDFVLIKPLLVYYL